MAMQIRVDIYDSKLQHGYADGVDIYDSILMMFAYVLCPLHKGVRTSAVI